MDRQARAALGYGLVGLMIGLFVLPFVYLYLVREGLAEARNNMWLWTFLLIVIVPAALLALLGRSRASSQKA